MIVRFGNKKVRELYELDDNVSASKFKLALQVVATYKKRIRQLILAPDFETIRQIRSLNLEKLKGDRQGQWSIRVDLQYRICFRKINQQQIEIEIIELTDYH